MVVEINHHWVTFKLPGTEVEFRARYIDHVRAGDKKFEVQKKSNGRWVAAFSRIVGLPKPKAK